MTVTDLALARRLERAEGRSNAAFVDSRAQRVPSSGAAWIDVSGTLAMFDGAASPLTQTFCLGMLAPLTATDLDTIETFFTERHADTAHETCPLSDAALLGFLPERGYRPIEQSSVLWQSLRDAQPAALRASGAVARLIEAHEVEAWANHSALGWEATGDLAEFLRDMGAVIGAARGAHCFVAEIDGAIVGTAGLNMHDGVALMAGASTLPAFRGRGVQALLLRTRLAYAHESGCDIAMMAALPGSVSQTNSERQGFRIAYTRTKWMRPHIAG